MKNQSILKLPQPQAKGRMPLEVTFSLRKTARNFSSRIIDLSAVSQLLWSVQGITHIENLREAKKILHRAAPSAGKTYPLEVYLASSKGFFRYEPETHSIYCVNETDIRPNLSEAAIAPSNREAIRTAPLTMILAADNERALKATPLLENAVRFAHLEAGHATQNLLLQAASLGLGVCTMTSYNISKVYEVSKLPLNHRPIYLLPIGFPKEEKKQKPEKHKSQK